MNYRTSYLDFLKNKRQPVNYLPLILDLQQSLLKNNQAESKIIATKLEEMARLERTSVLEEYLLHILSRLMYVQGEKEIVEFTYSDIIFNLKKIWTYNRLTENRYYIARSDWHSHFGRVLDAAEGLASEACLSNELRNWSEEYDRELLWQEANRILALTYSNEREEIDSALRSLLSYYTFLPY